MGSSGAFNGRGYLGLDTTNTLGWALPTDNSFASYSSEFSMAQVITLGGSTTLKCKQISTDPAPAGGNFSSGAPAISSPDYTAGCGRRGGSGRVVRGAHADRARSSADRA